MPLKNLAPYGSYSLTLLHTLGSGRYIYLCRHRIYLCNCRRPVSATRVWKCIVVSFLFNIYTGSMVSHFTLVFCYLCVQPCHTNKKCTHLLVDEWAFETAWKLYGPMFCLVGKKMEHSLLYSQLSTTEMMTLGKMAWCNMHKASLTDTCTYILARCNCIVLAGDGPSYVYTYLWQHHKHVST